MRCPAHLAVLSVSIAVALAACGKQDQAPAKADAAGDTLVIKLGHAAPLTGPQSHLGKDNENGARMAIEDLNAQKLVIGGKPVKFELMAEDDQADPKQGTIVAQKFADAKVNGVIGHLNSGTTMPASRIYSDANIPEISPSSTTPAYTNQGFKTAFRTMANDTQQGKVLAFLSVRRLGAKKVAIIDDRTAYGQGLGDEYEKFVKAHGAEVLAHEFTTDKSTDFKAILTTIKAKKPDLIFFAGMDAQAGPMMRQIKELGLNAKFLTGDGGCTPEAIKLAGDGATGQHCTLPGAPIEQMAGGPAFRDRYKAQWKGEIQLYAPYVYDAVMVMAAAMKKADSVDPNKVIPALRETDYQGVTSRIQFDEKGDLKFGQISYYEYKGGDKSFVETINASDAEPPKAK